MSERRTVFITKADGGSEAFDYGKLESSLSRAGASEEIVRKITDHIAGEIQDGMSTNIIFRHAFYLLKKFELHPAAVRYSLRRAMQNFGPTGFPFEKYIAEIFKAQGYETLTDQILKGACAEHELDVVAWNESKLILVEAKFHNRVGEKCDLKVALYVKARFDDLIEQSFFFGKRRSFDEGWLITNTKFSSNAESYGMCAGLKLVSWNFPEKGNLQDLIESTGLHPITSLTSLTMNEKARLIADGIVLCKKIAENVDPLRRIGLSEERALFVQKEARVLCRINS
jgi:hypothetical protein